MAMTKEERLAQGAKVRKELEKVYKNMSKDEQHGVQVFVDFIRTNLSVGYKQILSPKYEGALTTIPTPDEE